MIWEIVWIRLNCFLIDETDVYKWPYPRWTSQCRMVRFKTIFGLRIPLDEGDNNSATCPTATCFSDQGVLQIILWICKESFEETHIFSLYFKIQKIHIMYIYDIHMQIILFMYTTSANLSTTLHSSSLESWGSTNLICLFQDPRTNAQVLGAQVPGVSKPSVTGMLKGWGSRSWGDWWWEMMWKFRGYWRVFSV